MGVPARLHRFRSLLLAVAVAGLALPATSGIARGSGHGSGGATAHKPRGSGGATAHKPRGSGGATVRKPRATVLTVGAATPQTIAPGFLGLSLEYFAIPYYAGTNPAAVNPVLVQLIRNLAAGSPPVLRIGGDTTDETWWPVPGVSPPPGVEYNLDQHWTAVTRALATRLGARLILGINLEAGSTTVAATEARALVDGLGRDQIEAFEPGNEPELYGIFKWGGSGAPGRPSGYDFPAFDQDFTSAAGALPDVPLAGPAIGAPGWFGYLDQFLSDQPRVRIATLHRYPLQLCYVRHRAQPNYPTIPHLLAAWSTRTLAASVAASVAVAHAHGVPLRVDEMNTISCGSVPAVAQSFASALWALDILFQMASVGVDGVDMHTFPGATYGLFDFKRVRGRWVATVAPEYYGLEMFAQAAPAGSRLLQVALTAGRDLQAWATGARDGTTRVVVMNPGSHARALTVRVAGDKRRAALALLRAPGLRARRDVTLAGQGFGATTDSGVPAGSRRATAVAPSAHGYVIRVPAASAALLTVPRK